MMIDTKILEKALKVVIDDRSNVKDQTLDILDSFYKVIVIYNSIKDGRPVVIRNGKIR